MPSSVGSALPISKTGHSCLTSMLWFERIGGALRSSHSHSLEISHSIGLRWRAAAPGSLPHRLEQDEIYEGYFLPKGSTVVALVHEMNNDAEAFSEPGQFRPERFLKEDGTVNHDLEIYTFGHGRRVCPGYNLADASLFITISNLAWAFNIETPIDEKKKPILPDLDPARWLASAASGPCHFEARFTPRFPGVTDIIAKDD